MVTTIRHNLKETKPQHQI